jgi:hypothetical protein
MTDDRWVRKWRINTTLSAYDNRPVRRIEMRLNRSVAIPPSVLVKIPWKQ